MDFVNTNGLGKRKKLKTKLNGEKKGKKLDTFSIKRL